MVQLVHYTLYQSLGGWKGHTSSSGSRKYSCLLYDHAENHSLVILFLDGHTSLSIEITRLGRKSEVILFSLPSHTTHALQPLGVGVYKWAIEEQLGPNYKTIQDGACATTVENSLLY